MKKQKYASAIVDIIEEKNANLVDFIMMDVAIDKNAPFVTEKKIADQLKKIVNQEEMSERLIRGLDLAMEDLSRHLSKVELDVIDKELDHAVNTIISMMSEKTATPEESIEKLAVTPDTFQELLGISEKTIDLFYQSGHKFYELSHFIEASDIFFAISLLTPFKYNVWLALGMAEKERENFEEALQAFCMAAVIDLTSVYPHLHSALCYLALKDEENVKITLDFALSILDEYPTENAQNIKDYIYNLKKQKI